eukprot:6212026-Pleurochrysis_carterae.AAC.1
MRSAVFALLLSIKPFAHFGLRMHLAHCYRRTQLTCLESLSSASRQDWYPILVRNSLQQRPSLLRHCSNV